MFLHQSLVYNLHILINEFVHPTLSELILPGLNSGGKVQRYIKLCRWMSTRQGKNNDTQENHCGGHTYIRPSMIVP